jgi:hypothetical protein
MKVLSESSDRLVLEEKSSLIWKALKPLAFFSFLGLAASVSTFLVLQNQSYTGKSTTLVCSRPENYVDCKLEQKDAKGNQTINRNIHKVKKAIVREEQATRRVCSGSGENRSCEVVRYQICHIRLVGETATAEIPDITALAPTTKTGCNSTNANATAQNINNLISGKTTEPLTWSEDKTKGDLVSEMSNMMGRLWGGWLIKLAIAGSLIGYGIYLFNIRNSVWTFDKKTGQLIHNCQKLWKQSTQEYSLSHVAGVGLKMINKATFKCNVYLWYRDGENLRHRKLYLAKGERISQAYTLLDAVRPFCDKDYQIMEWGVGDYGYGERTPTLLKLCLVKRVFSSHHLSVICADKKQDTLTVQWGENANIIYRCTLSQVTQIQVHKQELKDSDGDSYSMYSVFLDLNSEAVNFPMYNEHLSSFVLQPMQFLGEFLDVPVKEIEVI